MNSLHWQSYCLFLLQIGLLSTFLHEQMQSAILTSKTINALIQMLYPTMGYDITITHLLFVSELYFVPVARFSLNWISHISPCFRWWNITIGKTKKELYHTRTSFSFLWSLEIVLYQFLFFNFYNNSIFFRILDYYYIKIK